MDNKNLNTSLPPVEFAAAQHFEYYGSTLTTNTALKAIVLALAGVVIALSFCVVREAKIASHVTPLVIRVNDVGRADAVAYTPSAYRPQVPEVRYFLSRFVTGFYGRNHKSVTELYSDSLFFLARPLYETVAAHDQKTQWLAKFLLSSDDDVNVIVNNVVIENLESEPYRARVEFTKVFVSSSGAETKRENWATEFFFVVNRNIPNSLVLHNPLGLSITYWSESQAF